MGWTEYWPPLPLGNQTFPRGCAPRESLDYPWYLPSANFSRQPLSDFSLFLRDQTDQGDKYGTKMTKETQVCKALIPPRGINSFIYTVNMFRPVNCIYTLIDS